MNYSNWDEVNLEDSGIEVIDGDRGKNYPNGSDFSDEGYCLFLNAKNVTINGFLFDENMFITKDKDELLRKGKLKRKDIVLTTRGTVGNVAYFNEKIKYENMRINSGMVILRCLESSVLPEYAYWLFRSPIIQNQIKSIRTGSAQPQLPITVMKNLKFPIPSLVEQRAIADTIFSLDNKIELNNHINKNIEEMVQTIFKSWFVDFEPFKNDEYEESELGSIPKNWKVVEIGQIVEEIKDKVSDKDLSVLSAVKTGNLILSEEYFTKQVFSKNISKYIIVKPYEFAYNPARINIGSIGMNEFDYSGCVSPVYVAFRTDPKYKWFIRMLIKTERFNMEVNTRASGSVRQTLNYNEFSKIKIVYPSSNTVERFNMIFEDFYKAQKEIIGETNTLITIRDSLLHKLMSGEVRVPIEEVQ